MVLFLSYCLGSYLIFVLLAASMFQQAKEQKKKTRPMLVEYIIYFLIFLTEAYDPMHRCPSTLWHITSLNCHLTDTFVSFFLFLPASCALPSFLSTRSIFAAVTLESIFILVLHGSLKVLHHDNTTLVLVIIDV